MTKKMASTLIIIGCILLIAGLTLSLKSIKPMYLNVISGLVIIIGTFFGVFGKQLQDKSSSDKSDKILRTGASTEEKVDYLNVQNAELSKKAEELREKAEKQATTIDNLRQENTDLYTKLADANKEIYNNLTGGDSYCKMEIGNINPSNDLGYLVFYVEGKNPLNRIQARIVDLNNFNAQSMSMAEINKNVDVGTLDPNKALITQYTIRLDKVKGVNLNIFFGANNGFSTQLIRMKYINDKWVSAQQITRLKDNKELYIKIEPEFPSKDKNQIFK